MSYAGPPETNPYSAPQSAVGVTNMGQRSSFLGYAGFWRRFAAFFIDNIIMGIAGGILGAIVGMAAVSSGNAPGGQISPGLSAGVQLLSFLMQLVYFAGMESSSSQATLGKLALGIKVVDLHGWRITFGRAIGRNLARILSAIILGIGYIMAAFTERKQALHDMMAGTLVVKSR
jgi:uncharacterized RDD family membrane protein YckC